MYDVIIIGAEPAGCTAAKTLSENGYKVLLAEKFKLPRSFQEANMKELYGKL